MSGPISLVVYTDTVNPGHKKDHNLSLVTTTVTSLCNYVKDCHPDMSVDTFLDEYTADETTDFYQYLKDKGEKLLAVEVY